MSQLLRWDSAVYFFRSRIDRSLFGLAEKIKISDIGWMYSGKFSDYFSDELEDLNVANHFPSKKSKKIHKFDGINPYHVPRGRNVNYLDHATYLPETPVLHHRYVDNTRQTPGLWKTRLSHFVNLNVTLRMHYEEMEKMDQEVVDEKIDQVVD